MEFRDLKAQYSALKTEIDAEIAEVIGSTSFISGQKVKQLEQQLCEFVGVKHCVSCASGTDALLLPLMAWGIGKGDAVFVPDFTFFATAEVAAKLGAVPVFVDINKETFNMDPQKLETAIEKVKSEGRLKPRAVIPVDLFGQPADYPEIQKIAEKYGLLILEDAAQGFGGRIGDKKAGSFGDVAATSFFPAKPLGCYGDGGAVFTNDDNLALLIRSLSIHGKGKNKYDNVRIGLNSRLDTIQAAVLMPKLKALKEYELDRVNEAASAYTDLLNRTVQTPHIKSGFYSSWAQYSVLLKDSVQREKVQTELKEAGIPTNIYYPKPLHRQTAFSYLESDDNTCPTAQDVCSRILALPMHPYLESGTIKFICEKLKQALG
ncbi:MAG TPA: DegT/DnrJ/EryC1/StrS family aminotransferase [Ruminiclostridium sp.]|nr:DegT/DnrJ/EryC1/StrS family aminotransferase [Ruminiclostridium sp.]